MKFLKKIIEDLLDKTDDLSNYSLVLPGKRPIVFIKKILADKHYEGFLPQFITIEELLKSLAHSQQIKGVALWLFAYEVYKTQHQESFGDFLKWFPTVLKDWDDMLKFSESDIAVLDFMFDEERIKNWAENLNPEENTPRNKFLNFWRKQRNFLPLLKLKLREKNYATDGMISELAKNNIEDFVEKTSNIFVFCGFNAFTPTEGKLVKTLLRAEKAFCYSQADQYYMQDSRQEAGKFLREQANWSEYNKSRPFNWIENDFKEDKDISVLEVSGNISQTKLLPEIFNDLSNGNLEQYDFSNTAVVLLDENLLPATLDSLSALSQINITMGFPLKNLDFSNAIKKLFYLQKHLQKKNNAYYYKDLLPILEGLPEINADQKIVKRFKNLLHERNMIYISKSVINDELIDLSYLNLLMPCDAKRFLDELIKYCYILKFHDLDDILYENVSHFESTFKALKNQLEQYHFGILIEDLEVLINQLVNSETIDFQGEPLQGLQVMGLLETRLLNFENVILLSTNEGKLPLGNSQNTYLPFDVRREHQMHTFLENDGIYAYHFYRLLQDSKKAFLLYNSLSSGINTGEKSRFITQLELESPHHIKHIVIENETQPTKEDLIIILKDAEVLEKLESWKIRISASNLTSYLYNPVDFYLSKVLGVYAEDQMEEELSQRNFGNLVHYALYYIYEKVIGNTLTVNILQDLLYKVDEALAQAIIKLNHDDEYYLKGMNFIHKSIAKRVVEEIINYDLKLVKDGNSLEILALEYCVENVEFSLTETEKVKFCGFIDRIDRLNETVRVIDYKTKKATKIELAPTEEKADTMFLNKEMAQAIQLSIYAYALLNDKNFNTNLLECGIWSFAETNKGVQLLKINGIALLNLENLSHNFKSIRNLILEILNPELSFEEPAKVKKFS